MLYTFRSYQITNEKCIIYTLKYVQMTYFKGTEFPDSL